MKIFLREPSEWQVDEFLRRPAGDHYPYPGVGNSREGIAPGSVVHFKRALIGRARSVREWKMFELGWCGSSRRNRSAGIPYYDEAFFLKTIRTGKVGGVRELKPIMPWRNFREMTDEDLKAIFAYLQTLQPVQHRVDNTEPPAYCKLCGFEHGFGDRN